MITECNHSGVRLCPRCREANRVECLEERVEILRAELVKEADLTIQLQARVKELEAELSVYDNQDDNV